MRACRQINQNRANFSTCAHVPSKCILDIRTFFPSNHTKPFASREMFILDFIRDSAKVQVIGPMTK